jgi:tRNA 2-thiouridine synthesizing protein D
LIYSLLVLSPPSSGHGGRHALAFARAALSRGHVIHRVFFLDDGVTTGAAGAVTPQDEADLIRGWIELGEAHGLDLVLCVSSALRRGMLDDTEANRHERGTATVHPAFVISGLGQLVEAGAVSDRLVTFGG